LITKINNRGKTYKDTSLLQIRDDKMDKYTWYKFELIGVKFEPETAIKEMFNTCKKLKVPRNMPCGARIPARKILEEAIRQQKNIPCPCGNPDHMVLEIVVR